MKLKAAYDNFDDDSTATGLECLDPSLAQQHEKDDCDINLMIKKYIRTGDIRQHQLPPLQGDFSECPDIQGAMNLMVDAQRAFMEQPAEIRNRFENDPRQYVEFCSDPRNSDEMERMGLLSETAVERKRAEARAAAEAAAEEKAFREDFRKRQNDAKANTKGVG